MHFEELGTNDTTVISQSNEVSIALREWKNRSKKHSTTNLID